MTTPENIHADVAAMLCRSCGICCQGSICRVVFTASEQNLFTSQDMAIFQQRDGDYYFTQSCPHWQKDGCGIYGQRPTDCRNYQCRTLKSLLMGKLDLIAAKERVDKVLAQILVVVGLVQTGDSEQSSVQDLLSALIKDEKFKQEPVLLKEVGKLLTLIDRYFHPQKMLSQLPKQAKLVGVRFSVGQAKEQKSQKKVVLSVGKQSVVEQILTTENLATPAYIIDESGIENLVATARSLTQEAGAKLLYSIKANSIVPVLKIIAPLVDGLSCSSQPEIMLAREVAGPDVKLHFTAPGLGPNEARSIANECSQVSFNSLEQWSRYRQIFAGRLSVGLRVNPHLSLVGKPHYDPCRQFSKLGIPVRQLRGVWQRQPKVFQDVEGIHVHNAVGGTDFKNFIATAQIIEKNLAGLLGRLRWINLGGGYRLGGCKNRHLFHDAIAHFRNKYALEVYIEPGTALVQRACWLASTVVDMIQRDGKTIAILDSSINHQLESFIYDFKPIVHGASSTGRYPYLLAGATCLAGDLLGEHRFSQPLKVGSIVMFKSVGAYTHAFTIQYNGLNPPAIYLLRKNNEIMLIKKFTNVDFFQRCSG